MTGRFFDTASVDGVNKGVRRGSSPSHAQKKLICISIPHCKHGDDMMHFFVFTAWMAKNCVGVWGGGAPIKRNDNGNY